MNNKLVSWTAFIIAVVAIAFLAMTHSLFSGNPFAIGVQVAAFGLMIWARMTFGMRSFHAGADPTKGKLITSGPYRYWRHPIYAAVIYFVWAGVLPQISLPSFAALCVVTGGMCLRMVLEERLLRGKYPEYGAYAKRTKRFVPFVV